jgi:two-component system aerobic respiration control sensor histidine kinase ArcB
MLRKPVKESAINLDNNVILDLSLDDCVFIRLSIDHEIIEFNKTAEILFSIKKQDIVGKNFFTLANTYHWKLPFLPLKQQIDKRFLEYNWEWIPQINDQNIMEYILAAKKDISKNEKAQLYLDNLLVRLPGSIYWKDRKGIYLGCNNFVAKMAGLSSPSEVIGKSDYELPWKNIADIIVKTDQEIMNSGNPQDLEENPFIAEGVQLNMLTSKAPLRNEVGDIIGIIGTSIDITELKKTQQALKEQIEKTKRISQSKAEFLSTASHEIRNPIGTVISFQHLLKKEIDKLQDLFYDNFLTKDTPDVVIEDITKLLHTLSTYYQNAEAEAQRSLNSLINLGDLHRMQLEGITPQYEAINLQDILKESLANSIYPNYKKIDFHLHIDDSFPEKSLIDYRNIYNALRVFVGNAIRFSHEAGRVKIKVVLEKDENGFPWIIITIQDFGVGISETQLKELFTTMLTEDELYSYQSRYRKPSLQLTQAKIRIEACGGRLEMKSALKKGTTVLIKIPFRQTNEAKQTLATSLTPNPYILVVEDDLSIRHVLKHQLEFLHYRVDLASTGMEAVELGLKNSYDLILMDITLPDINGIDVMMQIKQKTEDKIPFIAVTSHASEEDVELFLSKGMVMVLAKPTTEEGLKEAIEGTLYAKAHEEDD